jgi:excisionase family DNA binding protein
MGRSTRSNRPTKNPLNARRCRLSTFVLRDDEQLLSAIRLVESENGFPNNGYMPVIRRQLQPASAPAQRGMNVKAVANYAGVSSWQVRRWIREGALKPALVGNKFLIDRIALDRLLDSLFGAV